MWINERLVAYLHVHVIMMINVYNNNICHAIQSYNYVDEYSTAT